MQLSDEKVAVLIEPLAQGVKIVEHVVRLAQLAEIGAPDFEFRLADIHKHAVNPFYPPVSSITT